MQCGRYTDMTLRNHAGVTLVELIVTLAVLGIVLGITTLSLAHNHTTATTRHSVSADVRSLRAAAVTSGTARTAVLYDSTGAVLVTAYPDGRVLGAIGGIDRLAGVVRGVGAR